MGGWFHKFGSIVPKFPVLLLLGASLTALNCKSLSLKSSAFSHCKCVFVSILDFRNDIQCHPQLSGHNNCHHFRFSIVKTVINVSKVSSSTIDKFDMPSSMNEKGSNIGFFSVGF